MKKKIENFAKVISGYAFKSTDFGKVGVPVIKIKNIGREKVVFDDLQSVNVEYKQKLNEKYQVNYGDILISLTGSHINQPNSVVGRVARFTKKSTFLLNQRAGKFLITDETLINSRYLYYILIQDTMREKIANFAHGAANQANISPSQIESIEIDIHNLTEQEQIAFILSRYDDLIENNVHRIELLESMVKLIYDEWFVKFKFPGYKHVKMVDSGTDFGEIPEDWEVKRIEDFGEIITGKTPPTKEPENYGNYMYFIKTPDMHYNIFCIHTEQKLSEKGVDTQKNKTLPPNSIIVSCIGTIGVVSITTYQSQTNQQINALKLRDVSYLEYMYFTFKGLKEHLENLGSTGATMGNVNKEKFQLIKILSPSNEIIYNFSQVVSSMFEEIKNLQIKNQNLSQTRDLLLPKLISGEIDVSSFNIKIPTEDT